MLWRFVWALRLIIHEAHKRGALVDEMSAKGLKGPILRIYYVNDSNAGANCCVCEECSRTITSLFIESENSNEYGVSVPIDIFICTVKASFAKTQFIFAANTLFHWGDIQCAIKTSNYADAVVQSYIEWVRGFDFGSYEVAVSCGEMTGPACQAIASNSS